MKTKIALVVLVMLAAGCTKTKIVEKPEPKQLFSYIIEVKQDGTQVRTATTVVTNR